MFKYIKELADNTLLYWAVTTVGVVLLLYGLSIYNKPDQTFQVKHSLKLFECEDR